MNKSQYDSKNLTKRNKAHHLKNDSTDDEDALDLDFQRGVITQKSKYKTEICKNYSQNGFCSYWNKCQFAHGPKELIQTFTANKGIAYRTKRCKSFWETGSCRYGSRCQFLHYEKQNKQCKNFLFLAHIMLSQDLQVQNSKLLFLLIEKRIDPNIY